MAGGGSRKAIVAALLANAGIAAAKFVGFLMTGAASLLAESIHSVADSGNQGLLFLGGARARRRATETHPFGFGRERYFWAFVVALVLFSLGAVFALLEGIDKYRHPHALESSVVGIVILSVAILLEAWSFRTAIIEARKVKGASRWWKFIRRTKEPELAVVLLEDAGALIGLGLALSGLILADVTDEPRWDAIGSISIGLLLGVIAIVMMREMKSHLIGEGAGPEDQVVIVAAIESAPEVRRLIGLKTLHLGPDEILVGAKVELDGALTFKEVAKAIDAVEERVRSRLPTGAVIYIEPDCYRPDGAEPDG
jgi:cation diffusion facilitator family transporter